MRLTWVLGNHVGRWRVCKRPPHTPNMFTEQLNRAGVLDWSLAHPTAIGQASGEARDIGEAHRLILILAVNGSSASPMRKTNAAAFLRLFEYNARSEDWTPESANSAVIVHAKYSQSFFLHHPSACPLTPYVIRVLIPSHPTSSECLSPHR